VFAAQVRDLFGRTVFAARNVLDTRVEIPLSFEPVDAGPAAPKPPLLKPGST
jgi:hypothetical protein